MNGLIFVKHIDERLLELGLKRSELLRSCNLPKNSISNWLERGNVPAGDVCLRIADFLNVTVEWLITGQSMNAEEKELISLYRDLNTEQKATVKMMVKGFTDRNETEFKKGLG